MKIYTTAILLLASTIANAMYNPKMRTNFGANHAILRLNAGYFGNVYQTAQPVGDFSKSNQPAGMLGNMRLGMEAMIMVNNRGRFSESVSRTRPVFLQAKVLYDGFEQNTILTAGYAHGFKCMAEFPLFGQVKGYLSLGAAALVPNNPEQATLYGGRLGYNITTAAHLCNSTRMCFRTK